MELCSIGVKNNVGYNILMCINNNEEFIPDMGYNSRFCIVFIESGNGIIRINNERLCINSPSIICLNEVDNRVLEVNNGIEAQSIYFHPSIVNNTFNFENIRNPNCFDGATRMDVDWFFPFIQRDSHYKGIILLGPGTFLNISTILKKINEQINDQNDFFWPCRSRGYIIELLFQIYRLYHECDIDKDISIKTTDSLIDQVITYITSNYNNKITVESICSVFHTNRTTLGEKFIKATGTTIKKYIISIRVNMATAMLRDTLLPVEEIVERTGFGDSTHFGRVIMKYTGLVPSEYRKKYCWMK